MIDVERSEYLRFGGDREYVLDSCLSTSQAYAALDNLGFTKGPLTDARMGATKSELIDVEGRAERYCDFCGKALTGVVYEHLQDGRDRCAQCSETVARGIGKYEVLCKSTRLNMCRLFGITLPQDISVRVVSQERISKETGAKWAPSTGYDYRDMGVVVKRRWSRRTIMWLENGCPRVPLTTTIASCFTNIWQNANWDDKALLTVYASDFDEVRQGMMEWVGIQYLYLANEPRQAERRLNRMIEDEGPKGRGLKRYLVQYPLSKGVVLTGETPFRNPDEPLKPSTSA